MLLEGDKLRMELYGDVGDYPNTADDFLRALQQYRDRAKSLELHINSYGGNIAEALGIYNAIKTFKGETVAIIDGVAMSAASFIMLACSQVKAYPTSVVMVHKTWTVTAGNADETDKTKKILELFDSIISQAIVAKTGKSADEVDEVLRAETYFSAVEAREFGLVDEVLDFDNMTAEARESFKICARSRQNFIAKISQKNERKIMTKQEIIDAMNALSARLEGETKTELADLANALSQVEDAPQTESVNDSARRESIFNFAEKYNKDGALNAILIKALASDESLESFKDKVIEALATQKQSQPKAENPAVKIALNSAMLGKADDNAGKSAKEIYDAMEPGKARREFLKNHKSEIFKS